METLPVLAQGMLGRKMVAQQAGASRLVRRAALLPAAGQFLQDRLLRIPDAKHGCPNRFRMFEPVLAGGAAPFRYVLGAANTTIENVILQRPGDVNIRVCVAEDQLVWRRVPFRYKARGRPLAAGRDVQSEPLAESGTARIHLCTEQRGGEAGLDGFDLTKPQRRPLWRFQCWEGARLPRWHFSDPASLCPAPAFHLPRETLPSWNCSHAACPGALATPCTARQNVQHNLAGTTWPTRPGAAGQS